MSDGKAAKIIVPTDVVDMAKGNIIFSETSGLGDSTEPSKEVAKPVKKPDPCCED